MALIDELKNIGNAIRNKTGTTELIPLKNMASAIESISGGGGTTGRREKTGTFTIDTNTGSPTIIHNCDFVPTLFMVYPIDEYAPEDVMIIGCIIHNTNYFSDIPSTNTFNLILEKRSETSIIWNIPTTKTGELTESTAILPYTSSARVWKANFKYGWLAIE